MDFSTKVKILAIAATAVAAAYFVKVAAQKISDAGSAVADAAVDAVNPLKIATNMGESVADVYRNAGKNNTSLGEDVRKFSNIPKSVTNDQVRDLPMGAGLSLDVYQWLTGSKGNQVSDFNEWWDGVWK